MYSKRNKFIEKLFNTFKGSKYSDNWCIILWNKHVIVTDDLKMLQLQPIKYIDTVNIKEHTMKADTLIVGCGVPEMIKEDWVKHEQYC